MSDPQEFVDVDLSGARFVRTLLNEAVMRGVDVGGADIDSPWLLEGGNRLVVNGVDVVPFVDAELDRRFPGRSQRFADSPESLRSAWDAVSTAWAAAIERAGTLPPGSVDQSVDGEWSFAQTLRHLVMATDTWLVKAVLERDEPYHPLGQPHAEYEIDGYDPSVFASGTPAYDDVLAVRAERAAMVRDFIGSVTADDLAAARRHPWAPDHEVPVVHCLQTILNEEWEHLRYATRDLDVLESAETA